MRQLQHSTVAKGAVGEGNSQERARLVESRHF
jgi:hypothetical protein